MVQVNFKAEKIEYVDNILNFFFIYFIVNYLFLSTLSIIKRRNYLFT